MCKNCEARDKKPKMVITLSEMFAQEILQMVSSLEIAAEINMADPKYRDDSIMQQKLDEKRIVARDIKLELADQILQNMKAQAQVQKAWEKHIAEERKIGNWDNKPSPNDPPTEPGNKLRDNYLNN